MVLTDRRMARAAGHRLVDVVAAALDGGAAAVVLREKDLPGPERCRLARRVQGLAGSAGVALLIAGDVDLAREVGADGVHLASTDPWPVDAAGDPPRGRAAGTAGRLRVGRSCHSPADLQAAARRGRADYVTYSPVFATASKPGYGPALGLDGLSAGCRALSGGGAGPALVALGGIGPGGAAPCRAAGADGVAVMGAVMRAADPAGVVRALADEMAATPAGSIAGSAGRAARRSGG
jgi:thiamine-phosphate pyrophosphorylase